MLRWRGLGVATTADVLGDAKVYWILFVLYNLWNTLSFSVIDAFFLDILEDRVTRMTNSGCFRLQQLVGLI